jgi:outer membrane lipoprotein-sorting protein
MKKLIFFIFIMSISLFAKGVDGFEKIKTFRATITESSNLNNQKKTKEYHILALLPDQLKKEMISPSINKGEIYVYKGKNKTIYYPLLEQIIEQKIDENENYTLRFIRDLSSHTDNPNFKLIKSNNQVKEIVYNDGITIKFESFTTINEIKFPTHVKIFDNSMEVSDLMIKDIEINLPVSKKELSIDEITKN